MNAKPQNPRPTPPEPKAAAGGAKRPSASSSSSSSRAAHFFAAYFWFILKNVIGWMLIIGAFPIGVLVPGPGGLPLFLIGFALVSLPGKRRLTARALRGRQLQLQSNIFYTIGTIVSLLVPLIGVWVMRARYPWLFGQGDGAGSGATDGHPLSFAVIAGLCVLAAAITWLLTRLTLRLANLMLMIIARGRRSVRPWLRRRGIHLLPPRRRRRAAATTDENEILEIDERHHTRARWLWASAKPWVRRAVGMGITIAAWVWILQPLVRHWPRVNDAVWSTNPLRALAAVVLLAGCLAAFRALSWRHVLISLGLSVPVTAALRIWCTIELARYIPGGFFPLAGRINIIRPYGLDALVCTASHAIEVAVFFLANLIVAAGGLVWFVAYVFQPQGMILYGALALVPLLLVLLHPRIFYRSLGLILRGLGSPPITRRLPGHDLLALLGWMLLGVVAQLMAIWVLLGEGDTFALSARHLPLVAAAYSLAWCAGLIAVWVPAGIGVLELVFVNVLLLAPLGFLGPKFSDSLSYFAMLALMSIYLRILSVASDLVLALTAFGMEIFGGTGPASPPSGDGKPHHAAPTTAASAPAAPAPAAPTPALTSNDA